MYIFFEIRNLLMQETQFDLLVRASLASTDTSALSQSGIRYNDLKKFILRKDVHIKKMYEKFKEMKDAITRLTTTGNLRGK